MELFLVSRNLERVADLATNIGEDVVFLVEGKSIKHHAEDRGEAQSHGMTDGNGAERERIAAIDVGSNSVRLLVAEYDPASGLSIVDELKDQPRLAAGLARTGCLDDAAMDRAIQTLGRMREVCQRRGVRRIAAVATAAVREAENGPWFVRRVRQELDIPLRIIDPETEAALSYRSVAHHFPLAGERTIVADIGGGSLELIGAVDGLVELTLSLPLGAVWLTELYLTGRRAHPARDRGAPQKHPEAAEARTLQPRVGGGRGDRLGRHLHHPRPRQPGPPRSVTGRVDPRGHGGHGGGGAAARLARQPHAEQRRQVPGLNPERADIILAGLAVTAELLDWVRTRGASP